MDKGHEVPLGPFTTLGVGGPADVLVTADSSSAGVRVALEAAAERGDPLTLLGSGSNVVVSDAGLRGVTVRLHGGGVRAATALDDGDGARLVRVDAGMAWDRLVAWAVADGLGGIELLSGIPGTVGAAPVQNIGAYGQALDQVLVAVEAVERASGERVTLSKADCALAYRDSRFKRDWRDRYVITEVTLRLARSRRTPITYRDLQLHFDHHRSDPWSLAARRHAVLTVRRAKSMVWDPSDPWSRSVGSFFVSPRMPRADGVALVEQLRGPGAGERLLAWYSGEQADEVKVPAALVLLAAGFTNGDRWGEVGLSARHLLAIVNHGGATAQAVHDVAEHIRTTVRRRLGVRLDCEPRFLGAFRAFDEEAFAASVPFTPGTAGTPSWASNAAR